MSGVRARVAFAGEAHVHESVGMDSPMLTNQWSGCFGLVRSGAGADDRNCVGWLGIRFEYRR